MNRNLGSQFDALDALGEAAIRSGALGADGMDFEDALIHRRKVKMGLAEGSGPINDTDAARIQSAHRLYAHLEDSGWQMQRPLTKHTRGVTVMLDKENFASLSPNEDGTVHARLTDPDERATLRGAPHTSGDLSKFVSQYYKG